MNYIELIKRFWELDRLYSFSGNETRLYFYLVEQANCLCWQEWFWHKDDLASAYVGIAKDTLRSCRNKLKQCGLIDFIPGGNGQRAKTRYEILAPNTDPKPYPKGNPKSYPNADPLNKHKTKTKTIPPLSPDTGEAEVSKTVIQKPEVSLPDSDPAAPESPPGSAPPPQRKTKRFTPPTLQQVEEYCCERGNKVSPVKFIDHYTSNGWKVGRNQMKDWRAAIRTWETNDFDNSKSKANDPRTTNSRTLPDNPQYRSDNDKF